MKEVIESLTQRGVSQEAATWAVESVKKGKIRSGLLKTPTFVESLHERFEWLKFVATHELGHAKLVSHYGGIVKELVIGLEGSVKGFVKYSGRFSLGQRAAIAAAGEAATGSGYGTESDRADIDQITGINRFVTHGSAVSTANNILSPIAGIIDLQARQLAYKSLPKAA